MKLALTEKPDPVKEIGLLYRFLMGQVPTELTRVFSCTVNEIDEYNETGTIGGCQTKGVQVESSGE